MRTIEAAAAAVKEQDPNTAISKHFIRQLIITGAIPSITAGRKYLVNLDVLFNYLENGNPISAQDNKSSSIRRIKE